MPADVVARIRQDGRAVNGRIRRFWLFFGLFSYKNAANCYFGIRFAAAERFLQSIWLGEHWSR